MCRRSASSPEKDRGSGFVETSVSGWSDFQVGVGRSVNFCSDE